MSSGVCFSLRKVSQTFERAKVAVPLEDLLASVLDELSGGERL